MVTEEGTRKYERHSYEHLSLKIKVILYNKATDIVNSISQMSTHLRIQLLETKILNPD